jgi:hypothetical protein
MRRRLSWILGCAALSVHLLVAVGVPHAHATEGRLVPDDCILCHAQHAPAVQSHASSSVPELGSVPLSEALPDSEERDPALGSHPARAPPA